MSEPAPRFKAAALACLFHHECGGRDAVAYRLSFARIGASGASFGRLQADCHVNPTARAALAQILKAAGMASDRIATIEGWLALRMPRGWIGAPADLRDIDAAIAAPAGRALVDAEDAALLDGVLLQLERCRTSAARNGAALADDAALAICLWTNQAGPPTTLRLWLAGETATLGGQDLAPLPPDSTVSLDLLIDGYLRHVPFEAAYPAQLAALREAVAVGLGVLGAAPAAPPGAEEAETAQLNRQALEAAERVA